MKNYALVLFLSLFAFAAKANGTTQNTLAHPVNEMALEVGSDALPELTYPFRYTSLLISK